MSPVIKPTVLLVQGSFQLPEVYNQLTRTITNQGYTIVHPHLPSLTESSDLGSISLAEDALVITNELKRLVEEEFKNVIVLMHSYGGLVGSEAVPEELSWAKRQDKGLDGGVIHLLYVAAFVLPEGQSVLGAFGESPNNLILPNGRFRIQNAAKNIYSDLPKEEAQHWESKIIDQSYAVQTTKLTRAAYRYIPSSYVVCENDRAAPPEYQRMFAEAATAEVYAIAAGHSPWFTKMDELFDIIESVAEKAWRTN